MRHGLFAAAAAALLLAPAATPAADPPVVFQAQPVGKLLDDARTFATALAGEKAAKELNDGIKKALGDKGLAGLDLTRPVVGYVLIPADPEQSTAVVALPVTGEAEFLDLVERANKQKPKPAKDGLYELPAPGPGADGMKAVMRFSDGFAYLAAGKNPAPALDPKELVPMAKLFDPAERAQLAGKVYFDRLPKELRAKLTQGINEAKASIAGFPIRLDPAVSDALKGATEELSKLGTRYLDEIQAADTLTARVSVEPSTGEAAFELGLAGKPGSTLAKDVAGRKPTTNRFAGLVTKDAAVGGRLQLPTFAPELRKAEALGLDSLHKAAKGEAPPMFHKVLDELFKGLARTVEAGELDVGGAMRGPNAAGTYTIVGGVSFDDPRALEKELKELVGGIPEAKALVTFDAAKAEGVSIHTVKIPELPAEPRKVFGDGATVAVAFAPKGVYAAFGSDAVTAVKEALAAKPGPAAAADVIVNPSRLAKLVGAFGGNAADVAKVFGSADAPLTAFALSIDGGKELRVRLALNLKVIGSFVVAREASATFEPPPPAIKK